MRLLNNSDICILAKGRFPGSLDLGQNLLSFSPPEVTLGIEVRTKLLGELEQQPGRDRGQSGALVV